MFWRSFALNNDRVCCLLRVSVSEGVGRGRAAFLSLEPGNPLLCPRTYDEMSLHLVLATACPQTQGIKVFGKK